MNRDERVDLARWLLEAAASGKAATDKSKQELRETSFAVLDQLAKDLREMADGRL